MRRTVTLTESQLQVYVHSTSRHFVSIARRHHEHRASHRDRLQDRFKGQIIHKRERGVHALVCGWRAHALRGVCGARSSPRRLPRQRAASGRPAAPCTEPPAAADTSPSPPASARAQSTPTAPSPTTTTVETSLMEDNVRRLESIAGMQSDGVAPTAGAERKSRRRKSRRARLKM